MRNQGFISAKIDIKLGKAPIGSSESGVFAILKRRFSHTKVAL